MHVNHTGLPIEPGQDRRILPALTVIPSREEMADEEDVYLRTLGANSGAYNIRDFSRILDSSAVISNTCLTLTRSNWCPQRFAFTAGI